MLQQLNQNKKKAWTEVETERKGYICEMVFREQPIGLISQKVRTFRS